LSIKNSCFFESSSSHQLHKNNNRINIIRIGGLMVILMFTFMGLALMQSGEHIESDDISLMEDGILTWRLRRVFSGSFPLGFAMGVLIMIICFEYLRSHIGEKRSASKAQSVFSLFPCCWKTTLFYSVVFCLFPILRLNPVIRPNFVLCSKSIPRFRGQRRF
jgi:hypothetical protein